ncbi:Proteinaceous RNase P 2 [Hibiscus syriacus]|uniref:Proteinaceous RNase P 2 n=1 Tax=Hibiscus syriacus TaxID=106335 RepID=A0A6A3CU79_HIBSY|nr:Proteinaceous RNase P 2 [Hibiscus syriacus]
MATPSHHQNTTNPTRKKKTLKNPEANFLYELHSCSKSKDLKAAISLYGSAISNETRLNQNHFNALLYLCSTFATDPDSKDLALQYEFRVSEHMSALNIHPNGASVTAIARLAAAKGDGDYAFEIVKTLGDYQVPPRLRTYEPTLFCFCQKLEADKAYQVEEEINNMGLSLEEPQIAALNGGGWHGLGLIGEGKWVLRKGNVEPNGQCCCCGEKLDCVDIDDVETEKFAFRLLAWLWRGRCHPHTLSSFRQSMESEKGSWHVPLYATATRRYQELGFALPGQVLVKMKVKPVKLMMDPAVSHPYQKQARTETMKKSDDKSTSMTGKRKERSP